MFEIYDAVGTAGVALVVLAYFLIQVEKLDPKSALFSVLNIAGSALILVSLSHRWNLASVLIELFWIAISFLGLIRALRRKRSVGSSEGLQRSPSDISKNLP